MVARKLYLGHKQLKTWTRTQQARLMARLNELFEQERAGAVKPGQQFYQHRY